MKFLEVDDYLPIIVDFDGLSIKSVIDELSDLCAKAKEAGAINDPWIDYEHYDYDGDVDPRIKFKRLETEKEREARLATAARMVRKTSVKLKKKLTPKIAKHSNVLRKSLEKNNG